MAQLNFDARTVKPDEGQQDPIPAAWYNAVMDQSELKPTSTEGGMRLSVRFNVIDGPYAGRKVFEGLNLKNSNSVAQEIAYKQLSAIAHAVNVLLVEDSSQLHNIPLKIKVSVVPAQGQYSAKNEIKAYKNINEQVGPAGGPAPATNSPFGPPPVAPGAPGAPAWVPPTAAQPWAQPQQAAPAQAAAPAWAPPAAAAPQQPAWTAPQQPAPQQPQQPAWAAAPAPVAAPAAAPAAPAAAPAAAPGAGVAPPWANAASGGVVPPWMQQPAA